MGHRADLAVTQFPIFVCSRPPCVLRSYLWNSKSLSLSASRSNLIWNSSQVRSISAKKPSRWAIWPLPASAEVIHEHRGPREIVADIRLKGRFEGRFEVPCARCIEPVEIPLAAEFDLIFRPHWRRC